MAGSASLSVAEIRKRAQKPTPSFWLDLVPRRLGTYIVRVVQGTPLTPNHVTFLSLALGMACAALFATGERRWLLVGGVLYPVVQGLDCADGQLARLRGVGSRFGLWFDGVVDELIRTLTYAGLGYGIYRATGSPIGLFAAFAALFARYNFVFAESYANDHLPVEADVVPTRAAAAPPLWRRVLTVDAAVPFLIVAAFAVAGQALPLLLLLTAWNAVQLAKFWIVTTRRHRPRASAQVSSP